MSHTDDIEVFVREGCLNCEKAKEFLDKLHSLQPQLTINIRDVRKEPAALELLKRMAQNQGDSTLDYPAFVLSGQLIIGFTEEDNTAQLILDHLPLTHSASDQADTESCASNMAPGCSLIQRSPPAKTENITFNFFGHSIPLVQIGLPLFTVTMGLLDGLNYGSTWVLILMISLLAPLKDRSMMLSIAGTFIAVQTLIYFILMAAWLNLFLLLDISRIVQFIVGGIALVAGFIYFKNYLYFGHKLSITSDEIAKPGIYTQIRKIVQAPTAILAIMGTIALAIFVQLSEFTITSVFPALYTKVLTLHNLGSLGNYGYLVLYDLAYMLDDIIVLTVAVFTLDQVQPQERTGRLLKLISGLIMVGTAVYLLWPK